MNFLHRPILLGDGFESILTRMANVSFYAAARAATGVSSVQLAATSLEELVTELSRAYPKLAPILPGCSYLLDGVACKDLSTRFSTTAKIDVLPRFAGG